MWGVDAFSEGVGLAGEDFEDEGAPPALLLHEGEPEGQERIDDANLIGVAQADGAEADIGNELIDDLAGVAIGTAVEEVGLDAIEDGVGEVFPAVDVEGAIDLGLRGCAWKVAKLLSGPPVPMRLAESMMILPSRAAALAVMVSSIAAPGTANKMMSAAARALAVVSILRLSPTSARRVWVLALEGLRTPKVT